MLVGALNQEMALVASRGVKTLRRFVLSPCEEASVCLLAPRLIHLGWNSANILIWIGSSAAEEQRWGSGTCHLSLHRFWTRTWLLHLHLHFQLPTTNLHDKIKTNEYSEWEVLELKIRYLMNVYCNIYQISQTPISIRVTALTSIRVKVGAPPPST